MGQRSELLPSERAAGYKALAGALRLEGSGAVDAVAQAGSEGRRTVYRYMRLADLEKQLLKKVDQKKISVRAGAELAALSMLAQTNLLAVLSAHNQEGVTEKQAQEIVALPRHDEETIERCLFPVREKRTPPRSSRPGKLKLEPKRFGAYFEGMQTDAEKLDYIEEALMFYQEHQNQEGQHDPMQNY